MKRNQSGNLPVAEIIKCTVMGQQTIKEIDGRLKFLRIGDKLYTQPSQAAQPEQTVEPVAWQWLDSGTFRKTLPKTAVVADWNPLFKNFPTIAQPEQTPVRGTDAQILKEREITTSAIVGTMAYGFQNGEYPPDDSVWLRPFWEMGRRDAEREVAIAQPEQPAPARQPLTHTEITNLWDSSMTKWVSQRKNPYTQFARAIEAAHGITTPESKK